MDIKTLILQIVASFIALAKSESSDQATIAAQKAQIEQLQAQAANAGVTFSDDEQQQIKDAANLIAAATPPTDDAVAAAAAVAPAAADASATDSSAADSSSAADTAVGN